VRKSFAALAVLALFVAGCGGSKSGSAAGGASGATIAPADVLAFVSVNTDEGSDQWHKADALLKKFPIRDKLLAQINAGLSSMGVDFNTGIRPLLGPELDFVFVATGTGSPQLVAMTQPTDAKKFDAAIERGSTPAAHIEVNGWTVFSDTQVALAAFKDQADKATLANDSSFKDATAGLPGEANVTAYLNGAKALPLVQQAVPQLGALPSGQLQWLALALSSQSDSAKVEGAVKTGQSAGQNFKASLLSKVPSGSLAVVSFHGSAQLTQQLEQNPAIAQAAGQIQQLLGVGLTDIAGLIEGEGALYVRAGSPFPEAALILQESHPTNALGTLNKLAARLAIALHTSLTTANAAGTIKKLNLGPVALYYGLSGGNLVISDSSAPFTASGGSSITGDPVFTKAKDAAGLPSETAGFVYVNIKDTIPVLEGFAQTAGSPLPPEVSQNLAPLQSFLAYATSSGGVAKFSLLLQVR